MKTIDITQARALILDSQLLSSAHRLKGKKGTLETIQHLGYIQIDTLSVVARAHHHVLRTRVSNYQVEHLKELEEQDRQVFEYWAHAASYLPMKDYRFTLPRKNTIGNGDGFWYEKQPKQMNYILDRFKAEGPLMSRDFKEKVEKKTGSVPVWSSNPTRRALQQLFMEGTIMVQSRKGFQKVFDLTERVLPSNIDQSMPSKTEYLEYLILRDIRAHRLIKARDIAYLIRYIKVDLKAKIKEMLKEGLIEEVYVNNQGGEPYLSLPNTIEPLLQSIKLSNTLKILSPFDNLIIQRKRTSELFNFNYTLECYVPAAKRVVGYFSLPLLWNDRFVGQIDAKVDRKTQTLFIKNLVLEEKTRLTKKLQIAFFKALNEFSSFNACTSIKLPATIKSLFSNELLIKYQIE